MFGTVAKFWPDRGYGFIDCEDGGRVFFSARSVISESVDQWDSVDFTLGEDRRKPGDMVAVNVQKAGSPVIDEEPGRLFVTGLPPSCTADDLRSCMEQVGPVLKVDLIVDPDTGEPKFAFIQMQNPKDALQAICDFHGVEWGGRIISVRQSVKKSRMARRA